MHIDLGFFLKIYCAIVRIKMSPRWAAGPISSATDGMGQLLLLIDQRRGFETRPLTEVRGIPTAPPDPREAELERLRLSLARASKRIDEFEARLKRTDFARNSIRNLTTTENSFANHVAACVKKRRALNWEFGP